MRSDVADQTVEIRHDRNSEDGDHRIVYR